MSAAAMSVAIVNTNVQHVATIADAEAELQRRRIEWAERVDRAGGIASWHAVSPDRLHYGRLLAIWDPVGAVLQIKMTAV